MLDARHLTKRYNSVLAVENVSFQIEPGEILGYLGPNGSGKSTTINMVVGLLEPSSGTLSLYGERLYQDPSAYKRRIGYVPEEPYLYTHLTAVEYLSLVAGCAHAAGCRHDKSSALLQLSISGTAAIINDGVLEGMRSEAPGGGADDGPDLLVLDEPFSGLDVNAALLFQTRFDCCPQWKMILSSRIASTSSSASARASHSARRRIVAENTVDSFAIRCLRLPGGCVRAGHQQEDHSDWQGRSWPSPTSSRDECCLTRHFFRTFSA